MGIVDVFYYGKLRDTVSLEKDTKAPIDFVENIKKKVFGSSSEFARISSKPMMVAELRRWQDNLYSVFTYFIPGMDTMGRPGGFVAVTSIIHGALPSDRKKLFELYKSVHRKLIEFNIISENQQIKADSFDVAKVELKKLSEEFGEDIKKQCGEMTDISSLTLNKKEENACQFNPEDINGSGFVDSLADAGIAYVSSGFLTIAMIKQQQEAERKKQEEQKKKQEEQKKKQEEQKKKELTDELVKLKDRLEKVESAVANQNNKAGGKNNHGDGNHKDNSDVSSRDKLWLRIVMVLSLINLILICLLFFFMRANLKELRDGEKKTSPKTETVKVQSSEEKQTDKVEQAVVGKGQDKQTVNSQGDQVANQQNDPNAVQDKLNQITQSIEGFSGAVDNKEVKPKFGKTYDVSIAVKCKGKTEFKKGDPVSVGDTLMFSVNSPKDGHEFFVSGAHFIGKDKKMVIVDDADNVTVWYCHKEDEKLNTQCNMRKYPVQKK